MNVDRKIIEDCIAGKRRAQNKLYNSLSGVMLGLCMRYSKNLAEAEDILQEGFIKVFTHIKKIKDYSALEGWIRRIMINTAITYIKKNKVYFEALNETEIPEQDAEDDVFYPVDPEILLEIIQQLPEGYRMVLNLYVFEGYSHKEIAELLSISENTSKTQLFKARRNIRTTLESKNLVTKKPVKNEKRV